MSLPICKNDKPDMVGIQKSDNFKLKTETQEKNPPPSKRKNSTEVSAFGVNCNEICSANIH
uniref:Uncharacterized protein n=1 Tax=Sarcophilus harrisii TaxID=9305 RepID=A0A7N4P0L9_SARHA